MFNSKSNRFFIILSSIIIMFTAVIGVSYILFDIRTPLKYSEFVIKYGRENNIDEALIYSVIKAESGFKSDAVSHKGAMGLMQVMPDTAVWINEKYELKIEWLNLLDPEINIKIGVKYLKYLSGKYDKTEYIIAAYNAGEGNMDKWINADKDIAFKETRIYTDKVLENYKLYKRKLS